MRLLLLNDFSTNRRQVDRTTKISRVPFIIVLTQRGSLCPNIRESRIGRWYHSPFFFVTLSLFHNIPLSYNILTITKLDCFVVRSNVSKFPSLPKPVTPQKAVREQSDWNVQYAL
jgi:hypothetical protein